MTGITYFAVEILGLIVILILLYANLFESKNKNKKNKLFIRLGLEMIVILLADAITWLDLGWSNAKAIFWILITITYIVPFIMIATFSNYLYEHISSIVPTSKVIFNINFYYTIIVSIASLFLCVFDMFFTIEDGVFHSGKLEFLYYGFYIVQLVLLASTIISRRKALGCHDVIATISFCIIPFTSIPVSIFFPDMNFVIALLPVDLLVIYIFIQAETTKNLLFQTNTDELTKVYNRRAYEDDLMSYPSVPREEDFVFASVDINGLKQINDELGHIAGDEAIRGASFCLSRTLGNYGKVYRTGGDEFVVIFFASSEKIDFLLNDLESACSKFKGNLVKGLSLSVGIASKKEFKNLTVKEMSDIADKRMYISKEQYYLNKGVDRNGQNDAYKVLCSLYTKILKINISDDTYKVINMDLAEQTEEKGFTNKISTWLLNFGLKGYVHPNDLEEYLSKTNMDYMRDYFNRGKTSLIVVYRRKYNDVFKQVMMEIIPTSDYTSENQSLYLYVKNIDI